MLKEVWKDVEGYDGFYEISNWGNCKTHYAIGSGKIFHKKLVKE